LEDRRATRVSITKLGAPGKVPCFIVEQTDASPAVDAATIAARAISKPRRCRSVVAIEHYLGPGDTRAKSNDFTIQSMPGADPRQLLLTASSISIEYVLP
jgi:hypothetical protein